jgi:precorrin-6B methylase 2
MGPRCSSAETQVCHRSYIIAAKLFLLTMILAHYCVFIGGSLHITKYINHYNMCTIADLYLIINCHRLLHVAKINYIFDNKAKHTLNPANRHGPMNGHKLESFS